MERHRKDWLRRKKLHKKIGRCINCTKQAVTGYVFCENCLERRRKYYYDRYHNEPEFKKKMIGYNIKYKKTSKGNIVKRRADKRWLEKHPNYYAKWRLEHSDYMKEWRKKRNERNNNALRATIS